jgi:hypothetical protein
VENGGRAELRLVQQAVHDLWKARQAGTPTVRRALARTDAAAA